jgi:hypothetical protein
MKALVGARHERILGFTMIGPEAGEVVATMQAVMLAGLPYSTLRDAVLAHPTMAEGLGPLLSYMAASSGVNEGQQGAKPCRPLEPRPERSKPRAKSKRRAA